MKTFKMVKYPNIKQKIFLQFFVKQFGIFLFTLFISTHGFAQNTASRRAASMGLGANLSHLENYWTERQANTTATTSKPTK